MSDYQCWCLWDIENPYNINPDTINISDKLRNLLHAWEAQFDETLDLLDHSNIGFKTETDFNAFYDDGWKLFDALRMELPNVEWWYLDRRYDRLLKVKPSNN